MVLLKVGFMGARIEQEQEGGMGKGRQLRQAREKSGA